jgi:hypothetical protein
MQSMASAEMYAEQTIIMEERGKREERSRLLDVQRRRRSREGGIMREERLWRLGLSIMR